MIVSNVGRKVQRAQEVTKRWAIKTQRRGAVAFGIVNETTLAKAMAINETTPPKLPLGQSRTLIADGKVWVNSKVCTDPEQVLKAGDYFAVFPSAAMERVPTEEHGSVIRMRNVEGM